MEEIVQERTAALTSANRLLGEVTAKLLQAQDEERRRLARDLHDSAGQGLAVLGMNLAEIEKHVTRAGIELSDIIAESSIVVEQLTKEIRTTSYLLHPPLLDENGLVQALQLYVRGLNERGSINIDLHVADDFGRLPGDAEVALFRVIQESLTNIRKHSGSQTAFIRLSRNPDICEVEIRDEGRGIPTTILDRIATVATGLGIAGMRERIRYMGGEMSIESTQAGTRVLAIIPTKKGSERQSEEPLQAAV